MESENIRRARAILAQREGERLLESDAKPSGITTLSDIAKAERKLADAQAELRDYQNSTDGLRETVDARGVRGVVVEKFRFGQIEALQQKVARRQRDLQTAKAAWLQGLGD